MDFAGVVIGHVMFVGLLLLLVLIGMIVTDIVFASAGIDIIVTERAVGHIGTGCIINCIAHIVNNQAAVGWLLRQDALVLQDLPLPFCIIVSLSSCFALVLMLFFTLFCDLR